MNNITPSEDWAVIHGLLFDQMAGFQDLTLHIQGMLIGHAFATGELWETNDFYTTRTIARRIFEKFVSMTDAYGIEA